MGKLYKKLFLFFAIAVIAIAVANYAFVQRHMSAVLSDDSRNSGIHIRAHYDYYVDPRVLNFDLRGIGDATSMADVFRVLLQFANSQQDSHFSSVILSHMGTGKFRLDGDYFRQLGREYGEQNPMYTMRTFPEHVYQLDGSAAFGAWTGGLLGVFGKQLEDFNSFHTQWYLEDMANAHQ